jgi:hypothetical protein
MKIIIFLLLFASVVFAQIETREDTLISLPVYQAMVVMTLLQQYENYEKEIEFPCDVYPACLHSRPTFKGFIKYLRKLK